MSQRKKVQIKEYRIKNMRVPANVLIVGPSATRKNAAIFRVIANAKHIKDENLVIATSHPELYDGHTVYLAEDGIPHDVAQSKKTKVRIFEDVPGLRSSDFKYFDDDQNVTTVIAIQDYIHHIPRGVTPNYVLLFGGIQQLERVWQDFAKNMLKFKDFREIYLAATDEGDRYCDEFMLIRVDPNNQHSVEDVFFWGSLSSSPQLTKINTTVELVMNRVHQADVVKVPRKKEHVAKIIDPQNTPTEQHNDIEQPEQPNDEVDDRGDCCIQ